MQPERARVFVALDLPDAVRKSLIRWRSGVLRQLGALRPVVQEGLHVTLCFLGSQPAEELEAIARACETATRPALVNELGLHTGLWLPPGRPRVLAVELRDRAGAVRRLQGGLSDALHRGGWYTPETRPFLPHVTVARVPTRARVRAIELPQLEPLTFLAPAVTLYRSHLQRSGARYEPLASVPLG